MADPRVIICLSELPRPCAMGLRLPRRTLPLLGHVCDFAGIAWHSRDLFARVII